MFFRMTLLRVAKRVLIEELHLVIDCWRALAREWKMNIDIEYCQVAEEVHKLNQITFRYQNCFIHRIAEQQYCTSTNSTTPPKTQMPSRRHNNCQNRCPRKALILTVEVHYGLLTKDLMADIQTDPLNELDFQYSTIVVHYVLLTKISWLTYKPII